MLYFVIHGDKLFLSPQRGDKNEHVDPKLGPDPDSLLLSLRPPLDPPHFYRSDPPLLPLRPHLVGVGAIKVGGRSPNKIPLAPLATFLIPLFFSQV